jgi:hypothetical protein
MDLTHLPKTMKKLILTKNRLKYVNLKTLSDSAVEKLNLRLNEIKQIDINPLWDCEYLKEAHLGGNLIRSVVRHIDKLATKYVHQFPFHGEVSGDSEIFPDCDLV